MGPWFPWVIVAVGAAFGGFAQGLSGFAFGLIALSIWVSVLDPNLVAPLIVIGSLAGQFATAGILRRAWKPSLFVPFVVVGAFGVPLGVALLRYVDPLVFKIGVGVLLMLWCLAMLFLRDLPQIAWGGRVADGCFGWMGGLGGSLVRRRFCGRGYAAGTSIPSAPSSRCSICVCSA
jgi:uncharacterized membrane protein YfcA